MSTIAGRNPETSIWGGSRHSSPGKQNNFRRMSTPVCVSMTKWRLLKSTKPCYESAVFSWKNTRPPIIWGQDIQYFTFPFSRNLILISILTHNFIPGMFVLVDWGSSGWKRLRLICIGDEMHEICSVGQHWVLSWAADTSRGRLIITATSSWSKFNLAAAAVFVHIHS